MHDVEGKIVPLMEGGVVRILPVMNEAGEPDKDVTRKHHEHMWESLEGKDGVKNHHHHHHGFHRSHSFGGRYVTSSYSCRLPSDSLTRLHRALLDLTPAEFITMAFVLGTGIGSILHFIFMICLISIRYFRCDGKTRAERRAACKARRATRREERNVKREGRVRLDGEEGGEVVGEELPSYEDGEGVKLDEKA